VPQFDALVWVSTQMPPHRVWPLGQPQTPFWQAAPPAQVNPQLPQVLESLLMSVHISPQSFGAVVGQQSGGPGLGGLVGFPASALSEPATTAAPLSAPPMSVRTVSRRVRLVDIHFVTRSN
jgi:hypothetical protein